ncbi:MAG: hypothetical protein SGPRY_002063 [Prymnesium sp.]
MYFPAEIKLAVSLALRCGRAMRETRSMQMTLKDAEGGRSGIDPVTATDQANEILVTQELARHFPSHVVIGEEASAALGHVPTVPKETPTWVVDPIDGTQNFVHGIPLSVVSIGLCIGGEPAMGVVYDPYLDERELLSSMLYALYVPSLIRTACVTVFVGVVGEGAYLNGRPLRPDNCKSIEEAMVLTDVGGCQLVPLTFQRVRLTSSRLRSRLVCSCAHGTSTAM